MQHCLNPKWEKTDPSSSSGQRNGNNKAIVGGEIVQVQGGHIVRSTSRKDRHSKVCTAKGPRDRRVRLAAHTAIQFYDVQDRLGYDRPSKAVDWLINKAKSAIDELAQLPPWHPVVDEERGKKIRGDGLVCERASSDLNAQDSNFLPLQLDSDAIADTVKSFFPLGAASADSSSCVDVQFHSFQAQDLNLSLQSFRDSISMNNNHSSSLGYQANWLDQSNQRLLQSWNDNNNNVSEDLFSSQAVSQPMLQEQVFVQNQQVFTTQRGPLQSSNNTPSVHAWVDQFAAIDHHHHGLVVPVYPSSSVPGTLGINGYSSGFHIPARIQGDNGELNDGFSDKPSSVSSDSPHHWS